MATGWVDGGVGREGEGRGGQLCHLQWALHTKEEVSRGVLQEWTGHVGFIIERVCTLSLLLCATFYLHKSYNKLLLDIYKHSPLYATGNSHTQ